MLSIITDAKLEDTALKSEESQHEKWSGEGEMSSLRVGKSSVIPSEAWAAWTTDPVHLLVVLEEQIISPFPVISHCTNLRAKSKTVRTSERGLYFPSRPNEN